MSANGHVGMSCASLQHPTVGSKLASGDMDFYSSYLFPHIARQYNKILRPTVCKKTVLDLKQSGAG